MLELVHVLQRIPDVGEDRFGRVVGLDQPLLGKNVRMVEEEHRARLASVAARPPDLLVVGFHRARDVAVRDKADVRLVDPHAKGVGGNRHRVLSGHELVLRFAAGFLLHSGVVER